MEKRLLAAGTCTIKTTAMLKAGTDTLMRLFGWQPYRLSRETLYQYYISWISPKGRGWTKDIRQTVQRLVEAGVKDQLIRRELPIGYGFGVFNK